MHARGLITSSRLGPSVTNWWSSNDPIFPPQIYEEWDVSNKSEDREIEIAGAHCRHFLHILYKLHGPRGEGMKVVPYRAFAALTAAEVRKHWDFSDRFLMYQVAKALANYDGITELTRVAWRSKHLDRFFAKLSPPQT
jgi:hypothetical protein